MNPRMIVLVGMVLLAALARLIPHPPNFTPVGAVALFGAAYFTNRWLAFLVPLLALFLSDVGLEITTNLGLNTGWMAAGSGFYQGMWVIYATMALIVALGMLMLRTKTVLTVAGACLAGSVLFFLVTNYAWMGLSSMYPHTLEGVLDCYRAAIPFFHWTLLGDAFFVTLLFGAFALAQQRWSVLQVNVPSSNVGTVAA